MGMTMTMTRIGLFNLYGIQCFQMQWTRAPGMDNLGPVRPILDRFWTDAEAGISEYEYFLEFELVVTCRDVA